MSETQKIFGDFIDLQENRARVELDLSKTPEDHIRMAVEINPEFMKTIFAVADQREAFVDGRINLDSQASTVSLVQNEETIKSFDLRRPLSEQLENEIKVSDDIPEFIVSAKMTVG